MADIVLRGIEGALVGYIPGLRGREAVEQVIAQLLQDSPIKPRSRRG